METKNKENSTPWVLILLSVIISSIVSVSASYILIDIKMSETSKTRDQIYTLDMEGFAAKQRDLLLTGKADDEQVARNVDMFTEMVKGLPDNYVVLEKSAIVRGGKDLLSSLEGSVEEK